MERWEHPWTSFFFLYTHFLYRYYFIFIQLMNHIHRYRYRLALITICHVTIYPSNSRTTKAIVCSTESMSSLERNSIMSKIKEYQFVTRDRATACLNRNQVFFLNHLIIKHLTKFKLRLTNGRKHS